MRIISLVLLLIGLTGCFSLSYSPIDSPEYPFEFTIYNDGRCEGKITPDNKRPVKFFGKFSGTSADNDPDPSFEKVKGFYISCGFDRSDTTTDPISDFWIRIHFEESIPSYVYYHEEFISYPGSRRKHAAFRSKHRMEFEITKYYLNPNRYTYLKHPSLGMSYSVHVSAAPNVTYSTDPEIRRKARNFSGKVRSCEEPWLYSKRGTVAFVGADEPNPNNVYMTASGYLALGASPCF